MNHRNTKALSTAIAILVASVMLAIAAPAVAAQDAGDFNIDVTLDPVDGEAEEGEVQTYEVVVSDAEVGIGAYEIELSLDEAGAGDIVGYDLVSETEFDDSEIAGDGQSLTLAAALADEYHDAADTAGEDFTIATVDVEAVGDVDDSTGLTLDSVDEGFEVAEPEVGDGDDPPAEDYYNVQNFPYEAASFTVAEADVEPEAFLSIEDGTVAPGEEAELEIFVEVADPPENLDDVAVVEFEASIDDTVARFVDAEAYDGTEDHTVEDDFLSYAFAFASFEDASEPIAVGSVTIEATGEEDDTTTIAFDDATVDVTDESGSSYDPIETTDSTVTVEDPGPFFEVSNLNPVTATVTENDEFSVSADVENTGQEAGTQEISLIIESADVGAAADHVVATQQLSLDPGENETVTFDGVTVDEPGQYEHAVASEDDQTDFGSLTVEEREFEIADDFGIEIRPGGLVIGDGYPLNVNGIVGAGQFYQDTGMTLPADAAEEDERFLPILEGNHVGLNSLPFLDEVYQWAANADLDGFSTAEQEVEISFDADRTGDDDRVTIGFSEARTHGLALAGASVQDAEGIDAGNYTIEVQDAAVVVNYDSANVSGSPNMIFDLEWEVEDEFAGLNVDAPNQIDFETSHRLTQADERVSADFVTFEAGATGISHQDTVPEGNFLDDGDFPESDLDGTMSVFQVWQDQRVTFEVESREDGVQLYEFETDDDDNIVLNNRVDPDELDFDRTAPGDIANLNTTNLAPGDYIVTFGDDEDNVVGLEVQALNLDAETPEDVVLPDDGDVPFVNLPVTADQDAEDTNVEAWFFEAGDSHLSDVIHVERETLAGDGNIQMDDISPTADLNGVGEYYAVVLHADSGITTTTDVFNVTEDEPAVGGEVRIISPELFEPGVPGIFDRGDIIPVELEFVEDAQGNVGDTATITLGTQDADDQNIELSQTVRDADGDGTATLYINTYQIGAGYVATPAAHDDQFATDGIPASHSQNNPSWTNFEDRNHGFFTVDDGTELLGHATANPGIEIYGGSQGGAVIAAERYDFHGVSGDQPWTAAGERDDVDSLDIEQRDTESFTVWTAPGDGPAAFQPESVADIEAAIEAGELTEIEVEVREVEQGLEGILRGALGPVLDQLPIPIDLDGILDEFDLGALDDLLDLLDLSDEERFYNGSIAENDMLVVQADSTGMEGVLLEAVQQQNLDPEDELAYTNELLFGEVVTSPFSFAETATIERPSDAPVQNPSLIQYTRMMEENQLSVEARDQPGHPNVGDAPPEQTRIDLAGFEEGVIADRNMDGNLAQFFIPYQLTPGDDLVYEGDELMGGQAFDTTFELEPAGGDQAFDSLSDDEYVRVDHNPRLDADSLGMERTFGLGYDSLVAQITDPELVDGELLVPRDDAFNVSGTTTAAPGTPIRIDMISVSGEETPFINRFRGADAPVAQAQEGSQPATWEITADFLNARDDVEIQGGTNFEVEIRKPGGPAGLISPGGALVPGEVLHDASVETLEFTDQRIGGDRVTVDAFEANRDATIQFENDDGDVIGESSTLERNTLHEVFTVSLDEPLETNQDVTAVPVIQHPERGEPYFEEDGERVEATASINVDDAAPAQSRLSNLQPLSATVTQGDVINTVSADIQNIGDETGEFEATLDVDGTEIGTDSITLEGGESGTVSFANVDTADLAPGEYSHTISTDDHSISGTLVVEAEPEPANFQLSDLNPADATVTQGDQVQVSAVVENAGDESGTQDIVLDINGIDFSESVTLDGGESEVVTFDVDTSDVDAGDYTHTVSSDDDSVSGSLTVEEPDPVDEDDADDTDDADDDGAGFGIAIAALALLGAALIALRRRVE